MGSHRGKIYIRDARSRPAVDHSVKKKEITAESLKLKGVDQKLVQSILDEIIEP